MNQSSILFLTICSNGKERGGGGAYTAEGSFRALIPELSERLIEARRIVFNLIKSGQASRMGIPLSQFPHNDRLYDGPDFGGCAQAEYIPA
jgi:hypothetical protein